MTKIVWISIFKPNLKNSCLVVTLHLYMYLWNPRKSTLKRKNRQQRKLQDSQGIETQYMNIFYEDN